MNPIKLLPNKKINLNPAQLYFILWLSKFATSIWGRGTGKSFIIAWLIHMIVKYMPRSSWGIVGRTFAGMLEITLLPTFYALELFGYEMDKDYFVRKKPPEKADFVKPLKPVTKYDYVITFFNGTTFQLISQDRNSRGSDLQGLICDESLNLDKSKFDSQILPSLRGFKDEFSHVPFYRGIYHFSSMPDITAGKWLLDHADYYKEDGYDFDILTKKLIKLQLALIDAPDNKLRREILPEINEIRKQLKFYKSKAGMFYSEANVFDNINNVGLEYVLDLRKTMLDLTFRIEVLNEKVASILNGFYCNLDEVHLYDNYNYSHIDLISHDRKKLGNKDCRFDNDIDKHRHLHLGLDMGTHINVGAVSQYLHSEIRFLKDFYQKSPNLLKHLVEDFKNYYQYHKKKMVKISFDVASSHQQQYKTNKTLINQVKADLVRAGWTVSILSKGRKLSHHERYDLINDMYLQSYIDDPRQRKYPLLKYHRYNCHNLIVALGNTEVKQVRKGFEKDKAGERNPANDQLREPHLTDAHDYIIDDLLKDHYKNKPSSNLGLFG